MTNSNRNLSYSTCYKYMEESHSHHPSRTDVISLAGENGFKPCGYYVGSSPSTSTCYTEQSKESQSETPAIAGDITEFLASWALSKQVQSHLSGQEELKRPVTSCTDFISMSKKEIYLNEPKEINTKLKCMHIENNAYKGNMFWGW